MGNQGQTIQGGRWQENGSQGKKRSFVCYCSTVDLLTPKSTLVNRNTLRKVVKPSPMGLLLIFSNSETLYTPVTKTNHPMIYQSHSQWIEWLEVAWSIFVLGYHLSIWWRCPHFLMVGECLRSKLCPQCLKKNDNSPHLYYHPSFTAESIWSLLLRYIWILINFIDDIYWVRPCLNVQSHSGVIAFIIPMSTSPFEPQISTATPNSAPPSEQHILISTSSLNALQSDEMQRVL
jgi:hypothetical protein